MSEQLLKATVREREIIRDTLLGECAQIYVQQNADQTWFAEVAGVVIESDGPAALLREIAAILLEQ